ncbi:MAG: DUF86 domain-containing protein [Methanolinea sp.]|jgi:uncharacterized protein with HEPN domain|nr:DUF86 domain-containing protein [Methanolinea sp.]
MRTDRDRLLDILESIRRIREKLPDTKEEFIRSDLLQVWVIYHIQVIGEAANGLSSGFRESHRAIPWQDVIGMRHILVHHYFGIDITEVWNTATIDLPEMEQEIRMILEGDPG